jgi:hypothetical protein
MLENYLMQHERNSSFEQRQPTTSDQAFLDAFERGGKDEISLIDIEPKLWLKGIIGLETGRLPSEISDKELIKWLEGRGGWKPNS